jgi:hypothetical protein
MFVLMPCVRRIVGCLEYKATPVFRNEEQIIERPDIWIKVNYRATEF